MSKPEIVENLAKKQQEHFDALNSIELKNIGKNFTADEAKDICAVLPSNCLKLELERREKVALEIIKELMETLSSIYGKDMSLDEMEALISKIREIVRVNKE